MASKKNRIQLLQKKAEDKYVTELFKLKIEDGKLDDLPYKINSQVKSLLKEYNDYVGTDGKFGSSKYPHCFVTFNPDKKYDDKPLEFVDIITRVTEKKWAKNIIFVFEQRSIKPNIWEGIHCHMLIERRHKRESEFKREIRSTVKSIGDVKNESILNFSFRPTKEMDKTIAYILGEKDEEKSKKLPQDELMRNELHLNPYYVKGDLYDPEYISDEEEEEEGSDEEEEEEEPEEKKPEKKFGLNKGPPPPPNLPDIVVKKSSKYDDDEEGAETYTT
jgi:hypothetical protein